MFLTLLLGTLAVAILTAWGVARAFESSVARILDRLVGADLASAWTRYLRFAILVVGISGGVRIYQLERYIQPQEGPEFRGDALVLDANRWALELYGTLIGTLVSVAWLLLLFFLVSLVAFVISKGLELRRGTPTGGEG